MIELSEKTRLINICLGFVRDIGHWPSFLKDSTYDLEIIHPEFLNESGDTVRPDLLLSSGYDQHVLVTEVAENGISDDLQEKYSKIASEDLLMEVENLRPDSLSHEIFYLGGESAEQSLANQDLNDAVLIVVGNRYERHNKFDQSGLNNNVKSGRLPNNKPPEHFYPFSPDDDRYYIAKFLSQELVHFASRNPRDGIEFDVDELLENSCKSWDYIRDKEKEKLRRKANGVLKMFDEMNLDENIKKLDDRRYFVRSSQALQEKCQKVVSKLENDATLDDYNGISSTK